MKKQLYIILTLLCLLPATLLSQGSGYMGKHFIVNAEIINTPCYFIPNFKGNQGYFAFDYILTPSIEYIVGKRATLGATFLYQKSRCEEFTIWSNDNYYGAYDYTSMGGGLFFKLYFGRHSSIIGNYLRLELDIYNVNPDMRDEYDASLRSLMGGFRFEFGKDFVFFKRLKLNMGIGMGLLIGPNMGDLLDEASYSYDVREAVQGAVTSKMFRNYFFGLRMGVGFIAF